MRAETYDFGPFTLDVSGRILRRGHELISLTPKLFDTLTLLVRNQGKLLTKEEIIREVWPDAFVEEGSISQNIFQLRRIIGEAFIQTAPRRGYRFVPSTTIASIAVLPFLNLSGDEEFGYFVDGLTDEILSTLASVGGLRVPARSSAFRFAGKPYDLSEIGQALNVSAVMEGSVRRHGPRVKVTAQLSSVTDGYCLWSDSYVREGDDVLAIQYDIASAIVRSLKVRTSFERRQSTNARAYHLYLKGRHFWNKRPVGVDRAIQFFEQAVNEDRSYALAYAGLADCYSTKSAWESGMLAPSEGFPRARALAAKALELNPELAEAHTTLAYTDLHFRWDWASAERGFRRAIALSPGYLSAHHWYSHLLTALNRTAESLDESLTTLDLDPLDLIANVHLAWHYFYAGELSEMEAAVEATRDLHPNAHWTYFFLGWVRERQGRFGDAANALGCALAASDASPVMQTAAARALALNGDTERARNELAALEQSRQKRHVSSYELALLCAGLNDSDEAFRYLEAAYEERSAWMAYLNVEPRLNALRSTDRFRDLLRRMGFPAGSFVSPEGAGESQANASQQSLTAGESSY